METKPLDSAMIAELREVMGDRFGLLCKRFEEDATQRVTRMRDAIGQQVGEALRSEAHSLKGASANVGATTLAGYCLAMEQCAKENNWPSASACLEQVEHSLKAVLTAFAELV